LEYMGDITRHSTLLDWNVVDDGEYYTFLDPKLMTGLLKCFDEDIDVTNWFFFEDPLPILIRSEKVQIICFYGKEIPIYFEEYQKKTRKKKNG
jgi:hypothetical protein